MKPSFRSLFLAVFSLLLLSSASAHYDPRTGRWLSLDPIREEGGLNLYAYCGNDPVNRHDPLGLAVFDGTTWVDEKSQVWLVGWKFDSQYLGLGRGAQFGKRKIGTLVGGNFVQFNSAIQAAGGNFITGVPLSMMNAFSSAQGRWINKQSTLSSMGAGGAGDTLQRNLVAMMLAAKSGSNVAGYFYESPTARMYAQHYTSNTVGAVGGIMAAAEGAAGAIPTGGTSLALTLYGADVAGTSLHNLAAGPDGSLPTVTNQMLAQMMPQPWANKTEMAFGGWLGARALALNMGHLPRGYASSFGPLASIENLATTPLSKNIAGLADDAIVHFGPEGYSTIQPGAGGQVFTFRFGDVKHLTPKQIEFIIGPLARSGVPGGSRVMHVLDADIRSAIRMEGGMTHQIPEFIFDRPIQVINGFIVQ